MRVKLLVLVVLAAVLVLAASAVSAAVTFDAETGTGFVGKGDVQSLFGWNNKAFQESALGVEFRVSSITETTWDCWNSNNDKIQERSRAETIQGVIMTEARTNNQITGFILNGYASGSVASAEGPELNSCPSGPWSYVEGSTSTESLGSGGLEVRQLGGEWLSFGE
jgi:hypothetical protein